MEVQEAYRRKMAAQLKEWSAQINLLEAKVENAGADVRVRCAEELHNLRSKERAASAALESLDTATSEVLWAQVKETADKIWQDLKDGVSDAHARLK